MKFFFKLNTKSDLIIFGNHNIHLNFKNINIFYFNKNNIYLDIFFKALLESLKSMNLRMLKKYYFIKLINQLDCKIAIGDDMSGYIFKFKNLFPTKIAIGYQFGYIYKSYLFFFKNLFRNNCLDYFFCLNENQKNLIKQKIPSFKTKFLIGGYLHSNQIKINKKKKKYDVMYVSEFRNINEKFTGKYADKLRKREIVRRKIQIKMVKKLSKFSKINKLKIVIALVSNRPDKKYFSNYKKNLEINFFNNINPKFILVNKLSYNLAAECKMVISSLSNLGHELFSRGYKVIFYDNENKNLDNNSFSKGNFNFMHNLNDKETLKKLTYFFKLNNRDWEKKIEKTSKIYFNNDNLRLIRLIKNNL